MSPRTEPITLPIAWDRDRLVITDPVANARMGRARLSPSTALAMNGSPSCYVAKKLMRSPEDPFDPAPLGTQAHAVMEALMQRPGQERTRETADELLLAQLVKASAADPKHSWPGIRPERAAEWVEQVRQKYAGLFAIEDPVAVDVFGTEFRLDTVEVAGIPFTGIVDRADNVSNRRGEPRIGIRDYKTGKAKTAWALKTFGDDHGYQIRLYIMAMSALLDRPTSHFTGSIYYTDTKYAQARRISSPKRLLEETGRQFVTAWTDLNSYVKSASYPCRPGPLCGWCPLVSICPAAQAAGFGPRMDGIPSADQFAPVPVIEPLDRARFLVEFEAAKAAKNTDARHRHEQDPTPDSAHLNELADRFGARHSAALGTARPPRGEPVHATHVTGESGDTEPPRTDEGARIMATMLREGKPYDETTGPKATLNPNSYAAMAVFGITSLAVDTLRASGFALKGSVVREFAQMLASIVARVQVDLTGSTSFQDGMHSRLRGALRTAMDTATCPLGGTEEELTGWADLMVRRTESIATTAVELWDRGEPTMPELNALTRAKKESRAA